MRVLRKVKEVQLISCSNGPDDFELTFFGLLLAEDYEDAIKFWDSEMGERGDVSVRLYSSFIGVILLCINPSGSLQLGEICIGEGSSGEDVYWIPSIRQSFYKSRFKVLDLFLRNFCHDCLSEYETAPSGGVCNCGSRNIHFYPKGA